jgi:hypothetical protein
MERVQIQLEPEQLEALRRLARRRNTSVAGVVRDAVQDHLDREGEEGRRRRALSVVGRFRSGRTDVSERHDQHLSGDDGAYLR